MNTARAVALDPAEFFSHAVIQDPYPLYDRLRDIGPVHQVGDSGFYLVCGWDAVGEAVTRVEDFSSNLTGVMVFSGGALRAHPMGEVGSTVQALATADDPVHAAHRRMMVSQMAVKRIRAIETFIADTFDRLWATGVTGDRIEWMGAIANRLPMMVVARLIGVPDADVDLLIPKAYASTQMLDGVADDGQLGAAVVAAVELSGYIFEQFRRATEEGARDNLLGDMATAFAVGEIDQLTASVIMVTLFSAGGESTASLLGSAVGVLTEKPEIQRQLRAAPELLGAFIEECLRFEAPFRGHYRHVLADTELGGVRLAAGARLLLSWGAANRDPAHFDEPGEFRLDRASGLRTGTAKGHIAFGRGAHFCVGAALARLEAMVVLRMLLERTSWIEASDVGPWLPSILVRRRRHLELALTRT